MVSASKHQPHILLSDPTNNRQEWKKLRQGRLGASQVAEVLGFSDRRSPLEAWERITGRYVEDEAEEGQRIRAGRHLEGGIANWWAEETNAELEPTPGLLVDPDRPWLIGTPDFGIKKVHGAELQAVLEVKNVDRQFKELWVTAPPNAYYIQLQLYLHLWQREAGYFAVAFGGNELMNLVQYRDDSFIDHLLVAVEAWYERHVVKDIPPPLTPSEGAMQVFRRLHPKDNGQVLILPKHLVAVASRFDEVTDEIKSREAERDGLKAQLMEAIGDNTFGALPDGSGFSFKHQISNYKATEARTVETRVFKRAKRVG